MVAKENREMEPFAYAVNFLSYRPRSRQEVVTALKRRGISPGVRDEVMAKLDGMHLVDDAIFAESWIHYRTSGKPKGRLGVRQELREKGLAPEVIEVAMSEYYPTELEQHLLEDLMDKAKERINRFPADRRDREIKRLVHQLEYHGFGAGSIYASLADLKRDDLDSQED